MQESQSQHISDLRVLLDKSAEREAVLASILRETVTQKQPPTVKRGERTENQIQPAIALDHLSDVTVFDEDADRQEMNRQEDELRALIGEQEAQGISKP